MKTHAAIRMQLLSELAWVGLDVRLIYAMASRISHLGFLVSQRRVEYPFGRAHADYSNGGQLTRSGLDERFHVCAKWSP